MEGVFELGSLISFAKQKRRGGLMKKALMPTTGREKSKLHIGPELKNQGV